MPGIFTGQIGCDSDQLPRDEANGLIHAADVDDDGVPAEVQLGFQRIVGSPGGKFLRVNTVDRDGDIARTDTVIPDEIIADIVRYGQRFKAPPGQVFEASTRLEYGVGRCNEGKTHGFAEGGAEKSRYPRMGVDDIRHFIFDDPAQHKKRFHHADSIAPVEGDGMVAYARGFDFRDVDAAV